jgi:DNA-binding LytR/AlgR family response regulator
MIVAHMEDDGPLREVFKTVLNMVEPSLTIRQFISSNQIMDYLGDNLHEVKVFLLDIRVPGRLNGIGVAQEIRRMGSMRPIIITSAYQKPLKKILDPLDIIWMPKPAHILNAAQRIVPLARS